MGFDRIAPYYDRLARIVFGESLIKAQTHFLTRIPPNSVVLIMGGGTGWWLKRLIENQPTCKVCFVEDSYEMLRLAKKATAEDPRIVFIHGTQNSIPKEQQFDVIVTFCFLDIFSDQKIKPVIEKLKGSAKVKAIWLVTDFVKTNWWHTLLLFLMYRFFQWTTNLENHKLSDWEGELSRRGFIETESKLFFGNFIKSALYRIGG